MDCGLTNGTLKQIHAMLEDQNTTPEDRATPKSACTNVLPLAGVEQVRVWGPGLVVGV